MKHWYEALFGERSLTKVAGLFGSRSQAEGAALHLLQGVGLDDSQVRLLAPAEGSMARSDVLAHQMEPEDAGIWRTIIRTHLVMGTLGALAGTLLYLWLSADNSPLIRSTPLVSWIAIAGFGGTFGLLVAGLLSLRPDHGRLINRVRRGLQQGMWAVVAHPIGPEQTHRAVDVLEHDHAQVLRTF
jgi:hypothetical protein